MKASSAAVSRNMGSRNSRNQRNNQNSTSIKIGAIGGNLMRTSCSSMIQTPGAPQIITSIAPGVRSSVYSSEGSWFNAGADNNNNTVSNNNAVSNNLTSRPSARAVFYSKEKGFKWERKEI